MKWDRIFTKFRPVVVREVRGPEIDQQEDMKVGEDEEALQRAFYNSSTGSPQEEVEVVLLEEEEVLLEAEEEADLQWAL